MRREGIGGAGDARGRRKEEKRVYGAVEGDDDDVRARVEGVNRACWCVLTAAPPAQLAEAPTLPAITTETTRFQAVFPTEPQPRHRCQCNGRLHAHCARCTPHAAAAAACACVARCDVVAMRAARSCGSSQAAIGNAVSATTWARGSSAPPLRRARLAAKFLGRHNRALPSSSRHLPSTRPILRGSPRLVPLPSCDLSMLRF